MDRRRGGMMRQNRQGHFYLSVLLAAASAVFLLAAVFFAWYPVWEAGQEQAQQEKMVALLRQEAEKNRNDIQGQDTEDTADLKEAEDLHARKTFSADRTDRMDPADAANTANAANAGASGTKKQWKSIWQMPEEGEAVGILSIPKINAELPVAAGATREQMKRSEGWVMQTDPIGSTGNAVVAGHRSYTYGRHFNRLGELAEGDRIFYTAADGTEMEFAVDAVLTVKPDDPAVFALPQEGEAQLTLYTCTPVRAATHRLIVRALRMK